MTDDERPRGGSRVSSAAGSAVPGGGDTAAGPALFHCFPRGRSGRAARRCVPTDGLVVGSAGTDFPELPREAGVAPRHARFERSAGDTTVSGLASAASIRVNGAAIEGPVRLASGDVLRLGDALFVYTDGAGPGEVADSDSFVGSSGTMAAIRKSVELVAARRHSVVVTGETGTGKEVVSRLVHERSGRKGPYIAVNCSTFTEDLLASELFGHARGSFTGAITEHTGLFRAARGGTLLLDELADIPLHVQAVLLRVLETQAVRPVGGTKDIDIDVRVIATTNCELVDLVQIGRFRADLYARLAQWTIRTPSVRSRREDIPELSAFLLARLEGVGRRVTPDLAEAILIHPWPLNVRGLSNILAIAVVSAGTADLSLDEEVADALRRTQRMTVEPLADAVSAIAEVVRAAPAWAPLLQLNRLELEALMGRFEGHVAAAARELGMTRPRLYRMLESHGLEPATFRRQRQELGTVHDGD